MPALKKRLRIGVVAFTATVAAGLLLFRAPTPLKAGASASATEEHALPAHEPAGLQAFRSTLAQPSISAQASAADDEALAGAPEDHFRVTSDGQLRLDERTRLGIEALVGIYTNAERARRLAALEGELPAAAYSRLLDLIERYRNYLNASRAAHPPEQLRAGVGDAMRELDDMHALRATFFGADVAAQLYGNEELEVRRLLHEEAESEQRTRPPAGTPR